MPRPRSKFGLAINPGKDHALVLRFQLLTWWQAHGRKDPAQKPWMVTADGCWPLLDRVLDPYGVLVADVSIQPTPQLALPFRVRLDQGGDEVIGLARFVRQPAPPSAVAGSLRFHAPCQLPGLVFGLAFAGARAVEANNDLAALLGKKLQSRHEPVAATFLMPAIDAIYSHCDLADGAGRHRLKS